MDTLVGATITDIIVLVSGVYLLHAKPLKGENIERYFCYTYLRHGRITCSVFYNCGNLQQILKDVKGVRIKKVHRYKHKRGYINRQLVKRTGVNLVLVNGTTLHLYNTKAVSLCEFIMCN